MSDRLDRVLGVLDVGLQGSDERGYGTDRDPAKCSRCLRNDIANGDLCGECRAFLLGDSEDDPAQTTIFDEVDWSHVDMEAVRRLGVTTREAAESISSALRPSFASFAEAMAVGSTHTHPHRRDSEPRRPPAPHHRGMSGFGAMNTDPPGDDERERALLLSMVGHTITAIDREPDEHSEGGDAAYVHLDDGRVIRFMGWGHDWWGLNVDEVEVGILPDGRRGKKKSKG